MRPNFAVAITLLVLIMLAAELLSWGPLLEYRRPLLTSEPWRLITGHFMHLSLVHAMLNCVALLLLGRLFADRLRVGETWLVLGAAPLLISLAFWVALPELTWYRGLSGTLHALYFAGCVVWMASTAGRDRWLPVAALLVGVIKVLLEQPWDASFPFRQWLGAAIVPQAHLIGTVIGLGAGLGFAVARSKRGSAMHLGNKSGADRRNDV
ncbi:MAG: rhombosortase [Steroidobacteraceae bacterium]